ncbi:hypothetical protein ANN_02014 [Periplaneta americana]|uniref:Uncharacterized protein n=1 Tax=Periplaneta americana TaxID=6978 RepID=A0ABQ8TYJ9_PERAM|nr:hypothetical protein ANN_02014 [Periplaneta americana]
MFRVRNNMNQELTPPRTFPVLTLQFALYIAVPLTLFKTGSQSENDVNVNVIFYLTTLATAEVISASPDVLFVPQEFFFTCHADKNSIKHATMRVLLFQTIAPGIPLPPQPVLTRWGTWLDAINYYAKYYGKIMEVIDALDSTDSSDVAAVKSLPSEQLLGDILFIDSDFKIVSKSIALLESSKLQLSDALNIVDKVSQTVIRNNNSLISEKVKLTPVSGQECELFGNTYCRDPGDCVKTIRVQWTAVVDLSSSGQLDGHGVFDLCCGSRYRDCNR